MDSGYYRIKHTQAQNKMAVFVYNGSELYFRVYSASNLYKYSLFALCFEWVHQWDFVSVLNMLIAHIYGLFQSGDYHCIQYQNTRLWHCLKQFMV